VYFYPKADTPGCTKQACSLRDSYAALKDRGVKIYGVSMDKVKSQKAFQDKYKLPFDLLADEDGTVVDAFGVPKTMGFSKRQAFLFKDGKLVWSDMSASTEEQAADVLKFLATP
jgi:peroxiredoxin Q/BCP